MSGTRRRVKWCVIARNGEGVFCWNAASDPSEITRADQCIFISEKWAVAVGSRLTWPTPRPGVHFIPFRWHKHSSREKGKGRTRSGPLGFKSTYAMRDIASKHEKGYGESRLSRAREQIEDLRFIIREMSEIAKVNPWEGNLRPYFEMGVRDSRVREQEKTKHHLHHQNSMSEEKEVVSESQTRLQRFYLGRLPFYMS